MIATPPMVTSGAWLHRIWNIMGSDIAGLSYSSQARATENCLGSFSDVGNWQYFVGKFCRKVLCDTTLGEHP